MLEFFKMIGSVITTLLGFLWNLVNGLVQFFALIAEFLTYLTTAVGFLPSPLIAFCMMGISVSILLMIIGRN